MNINILSCIYGKHVIQQRYVLCLMCFFAVVNCYTTRMCLHIAITEIAISANITEEYIDDTCPGNVTEVTIEGGVYNWTPREQGFILISFFPGYLVMHLPAGVLADKYGGRHVLSSGVLGSAILTILTPVIIQQLAWRWLVFARFLLGLVQASLFPAVTALLARWVPARQRSELGGFVYSGVQVGVILGTFCTGLMLRYLGNWPVAFYVWGCICLVWYVCFLFWCYSEPDSHPFITDEEKETLDKEFGHRQRFKTPWKDILKDHAVLALIAAQCGHDWITYTVEIDYPKYLKNVLKLNVGENGTILAAPFVGMWICSTISGYLSDYIINKHELKLVTMRIIFTTIASVGPSIFSLIAIYMGCNKYLVITFYWIAMVTMGPYYTGLKVNALDLSLNFSGVLIALANGIGVLTGIAAPYVVAEIVKHQTLSEWRMVFWIALVICTITNIIYIIWASGDRSHWDHSPEEI